jgi:hypothetical protein
MSGHIALTELARELARVLGESSPRPSCRQIYTRVLNGNDRSNGRWYVRRTDVPRIADMYRVA